MLCLPPFTGSLLGRFRIRAGTFSDVTACDVIARQQEKRNVSSLGWVMKQSYTAPRHAFHVAEVDGVIRGFVLYSTPSRGKNKDWNVVHALAVEAGWGDCGIGRNLLYSVPTPIRLKCPQTVGKLPVTNPANTFYRNVGMHLAATEAGNKRVLNVWELKVLCQLVQGNNEHMPRVARQSGMAYGTRHIEKPRAWAFALDIDWKAYDWDDYMQKVHVWQPLQAMAADYERPDQRDLMLQQVADLRTAGVLRVMVCPKFDGAVRDIPADCIVAISVPSTYAGYVPPLHELAGRKVHLLGGSPVKQKMWLMRISAVAQVISLDGNSHTKVAQHGDWWQYGKWNSDCNPFGLYELAILSGRNIVAELNAVAGSVQYSLGI